MLPVKHLGVLSGFVSRTLGPDYVEIDFRNPGLTRGEVRVRSDESGPGARPMQPDWVRSLRDQCAAAGVAFFFKQWGGVRKAAAGRELDGLTHDASPTRVALPVLNRDARRAAVAQIKALYPSAPAGAMPVPSANS